MSDTFYFPDVDDTQDVIVTRSGGVTDRTLPEGLFAPGNVETYDGDEAIVSVAKDIRTLAQMNDYGNDSLRDENPLFESKPEKLLHIFSHNVIGVRDIVALKGESGTRAQKRAEAKIARINGEQGMKLGNFRTTATYSALWNAKIWSDSNGRLLPSASGAARTASFQRSASHENQLGGLISATWATATNSILTMIKNIQEHAIGPEGSGLPLVNVIYGSDIPGLLQTNNSTKDLVINNAIANEATLRGSVPNIGGMNWIAAGPSGYIDSSGTAQNIFPSNGVLFLPASDTGFMKLKLGTYAISTTSEAGSPQDVVNSSEIVEGQFSRAFGKNDAVEIKMAYGTTELPALEIPDATYAAIVTGF